MNETQELKRTKKHLRFIPDLFTGRLTENDTKKYFAKVGWFAFSAFLITTVVQIILANVVYALSSQLYHHHLFSNILSFIPMYCVAFPIAFLFLRPLPKITPVKSKMTAGNWFGGLCICIALMMAGNYVSNIFLTSVQGILGTETQNPVESMIESAPIWSTFLFAVVLAPILEEIVFRGIVCKRLLALGEGYAIIIPSAIFALFHGNFYQLFYAFTLGCFFSFIYVRTGKLKYTVLYHMAINFIGSIVASFIMELTDLERLIEVLNEPSFEGLIACIVPLLILFVYSGIQWAAAIVGVVLAIKNRIRFKPQRGVLLLPEKKGGSCLFLNAGVAAAIALFSLTLVGSIFSF